MGIMDMNNQIMADRQLSQMEKTYSQLKTSQKEKIGSWMYEAYKKQSEEKLSDVIDGLMEEALKNTETIVIR